MNVRLGIIGVGAWGSILVRSLHHVGHAEVVCAFDTEHERLDVIVRRYPTIRAAASAEALVADNAIDAVVIATPPSSHVALTSMALQAGKHVFVEKPFALSSAEGIDLARQAEERGLVLTPGHTFLYSPAVIAIEEMIRRGVFGDVLFVSATRVNLGTHRTDVNVVWDLALHDLSILQYWFGRAPSYVTAVGRACLQGQRSDVAFIHLEYPDGMLAHLEISWLAPRKRRSMTLVGSQKMVEYVDGHPAPIRICDVGAEQQPDRPYGSKVRYRKGDQVLPSVPETEPVTAQLADFCDAVRNKSTARSTTSFGLAVLRVLEAVDASCNSHGDRVPVAAEPRP